MKVQNNHLEVGHVKLRNLVVFGILLVLLLPAGVAAQKLTAKEAAELVKERIAVPSNVQDFTSNYFESEGRGQWEFQWTGKKENVNAVLDAESGDVTSFYGYGGEYNRQETSLPKVSRAQALATAGEFLKKAAPSKYSSLQLADYVPEKVIPYYTGNRDYSFYYERVVNGVPCAFNGAQVQISPLTGKVTSYHLDWDYKSAFPAVKNPIPAEKAGEIMKDKGMELMYFRPYPAKEGKKREVKLVYGVNEPRRTLVDAQTGNLVTSSYFHTLRDGMYDMGGMGGMSAESAQKSRLTPIEEEEVQAVANLLSKEKAEAAVYKYFKLPAKFVLDNARLYEDDRDQRIWSLGWTMTDKDNKGSGYMSANVDAQTGELLSYSKSIYYPGKENEPNKYSVGEARTIGEKFLKTIQPGKMAQVKYVDRQDYLEASQTIRFDYARLVNGIPFYEDGISVEVDRVSGEILSFDVRWGNFNFPKAAPAISQDAAYKDLTQANPLLMGYMRVEVPKFERPEQKIGLYYYFGTSQPRLVDALSGKVLLDSGEEYAGQAKVEFTDIVGTPFEADIKLLHSLGIVGDSSGKFRPNAEVVHGDFIKMLVLASGWQPGEGEELDGLADTWYGPYYQTAVSRGLLSADNLPKPDQVVNRLECARYLVGALGLGKAAALEGIYQVPAKDADQVPVKDAGFAAIALKLGLMPSVNGKFEAGSVLNRGQAAAVLVRYMHAADK